MTTSRTVVVRTGTANLASVLAGLRRAGAEPVLTESAEEILEADRVVLPGVGAFKAALDQLESLGLIDVLKTRMAAGRPTLAICLGLQLLAEQSEESPGTSGLGLFGGDVQRFDRKLRVPQLGWNRVVPAQGCSLLEPGYAYFANSYRLSDIPVGWNGATADYGGSFVAAVEKGAVLACQFHPELSGDWGQQLLKRWLRISEVS